MCHDFIQAPKQRSFFMALKMFQQLITTQHLFVFPLFGLQTGFELSMKRVFQKRLLKILESISDSGFNHVAICIRHFKGASNYFINVDDLQGSVVVIINGIINCGANDPTVSVISPIVCSKIEGIGVVGWLDFRTAEDG